MRLIGLLNYIYTLKMKTLTLLFSLFLMCPLSVWGQSADELLSKVSDALSEGKDDYAAYYPEGRYLLKLRLKSFYSSFIYGSFCKVIQKEESVYDW